MSANRQRQMTHKARKAKGRAHEAAKKGLTRREKLLIRDQERRRHRTRSHSAEFGSYPFSRHFYRDEASSINEAIFASLLRPQLSPTLPTDILEELFGENVAAIMEK